MADTKISDLSALSLVALDDLIEVVDVSDTTMAASGTNKKLLIERLLGFVRPSICDGRLTLESGVPVSTSDQTAKTNIYFTPYNGNRICLYDGTRWKLYTFTEMTGALGTLSADTNYDRFIYDNAGTLAFEDVAWTNDTTRATGLTTQDGVYVKSGATTRRYLGTFRTTSTTTTEDSVTKRFLWNAYNRIRVRVYKAETTASWTYSTATWRSLNNSTANRFEAVVGIAGPMVEATCYATIQHSDGLSSASISIGEDSTSDPFDNVIGNNVQLAGVGNTADVSWRTLRSQPSAGYHYWQALEIGSSSGTTTFFGNSSELRKTGITGSVEC